MTTRTIGMNVFDEREKAFEAKYRLDEETAFKITARRNKLFGHWAASKLGLSGAEADAYARAIIEADLAVHGDDDIIGKVVADLSAANVAVGPEAVRKELDALKVVAHDQVLAELSPR
jgi:hypothetical protein